MSVNSREVKNNFPFVFDKKRFCRRFFKRSKKLFRSFLKKIASVGENRAEGRIPASKISPTELENRKNELKTKCEDSKFHRQSLKIAKTNGKRNVKIQNFTDRARKSQKRTEESQDPLASATDIEVYCILKGMKG